MKTPDTGRSTPVALGFLAAGALAMAAGPKLEAQPADRAAPSQAFTRYDVKLGPVAGIAKSWLTVAFSGAGTRTEKGVGLHLGLRFAPIAVFCNARKITGCGGFARLLAIPHFAYAATHLRGMNPATDSYAFSYIDTRGVKIAYPVFDSLRVTATYRMGKRTAERFQDGDVVNYWGPGRAMGVGIEIPVRASGRGVELTVAWLSGHFNTLEIRNPARTAKVLLPVSVRYRATVIQVGWSGPFTGVSLPWQ